MNASLDAVFSYVSPFWLWMIAGVALLIVEVLMAGGFFVSFALAGFVTACLTGLEFFHGSLLHQGVAFAIVGVVTVPVVRRFLRKSVDKTPDINDY